MSISNSHIASIRKDYRLAELDEQIAGNDPIVFFKKWFLEAQEAKVSEVNAMTLATVDKLNLPHARIVLLKGLSKKGFVFFTNYTSNKGKEIEENPFVAIVFFWQELERQVRIEGKIEKVSNQESDEYFESRPDGSKLGAWSSPQSQIITDRSILENNYNIFKEKFAELPIERPPHWGGYCVVPSKIEFWQGRSNRMHDRILFTRTNDNWSRCRLAP